MKHLIIDQGNTLLKIAFFENDELIQLWNLSDFSDGAFTKLISEIKVKLPTGPVQGIISDVSGKPRDWPSLFPETRFLSFSHTLPLPINLQYKTPETLGQDRIALAVGASGLFPGENILVIGAGTTITYDFITEKRAYEGGAISPGLHMRFRALHTFTGKLPLINPAPDPTLTGRSTEESILSGVVNGIREEVKGTIGIYENRYPGLRVVLTGGDMNYFDKYLKSNIFAVSNLVLVGLKDILRHNVENLR